jgi:hypothetical protein
LNDKRTWQVIGYCAEEVRRQGHNLETLDGIERVGWMLNAWSYALVRCSRPFEFGDIIDIGKLVERYKNESGIRRLHVRVGPRLCPHPNEVSTLLDNLMGHASDMKPLEFYKAFEEIHPFVDGNGRTGKVLLNWMNGTLLAPIFPPNDLFGDWIENP